MTQVKISSIIFGAIILVGLFFFLFSYNNKTLVPFISNTSSNQPEKLVDDLNNEGLILTHISQIEEEGYTVINFGYDYRSNKAILKMKSMGDLRDQLWIGLESMGIIYPNASVYSIEIKDERYDCKYESSHLFFWDSLADRLNYRNFVLPPVSEGGYREATDYAKERYVLEAYSAIDFIIKYNRVCSY